MEYFFSEDDPKTDINLYRINKKLAFKLQASWILVTFSRSLGTIYESRELDRALEELMDRQTDFDNWGSCQYKNERKTLTTKWESMGLSRFTSFPQFLKKLNDFFRILSLPGWNTPNTRELLVLIKFSQPDDRIQPTKSIRAMVIFFIAV